MPPPAQPAKREHTSGKPVRKKGRTPEKEAGRRKWIDIAWNSLGRGAFEPVRIEPLAKSLGITKGSFYWHFKDRQELIDALIDRWLGHWEMPDEILKLNDPGERLWGLVERVIRRETRGQGVVLRYWSHENPKIARRIQDADDRRYEFLVDQLRQLKFPDKEAKVRAQLYQAFISGEFLRHGGESLEVRLNNARAQHLVLIGGAKKRSP